MLASVLYSIYGLSRECHVMRLVKRLLHKLLRQFLGQIKIELVSQVNLFTFFMRDYAFHFSNQELGDPNALDKQVVIVPLI